MVEVRNFEPQVLLFILKFIYYFEKATNFCEISTVDLSYVITVKSMVEISQNFEAFSEYMKLKIVFVNMFVYFEGSHRATFIK